VIREAVHTADGANARRSIGSDVAREMSDLLEFPRSRTII
jgi:hypothetical protein